MPISKGISTAERRGQEEDLEVIGITGSVGKTSTKDILVELLRGQLEVVGSPASYNNEVGVPRTLLLADQGTRVLVCELGTNAPGEIASLCRIARPTAGIVTEVGLVERPTMAGMEDALRRGGVDLSRSGTE